MLGLALMLLVSYIDASTVEVPTYHHEDPETGQILTCKRCPAGTYMRAHCTPTRNTICVPCPAEHFTQFWNYLPKCLYCSTFCVENQYVKEECSSTNNRVCECYDGYYWQADFCIKHSECPSGYGVQKRGSLYSDTKCERCQRGTFSSVKSLSARCVKHSDCTSMDNVLILNGTRWHDNICATCQQLNNDGGLSILKDFLPHLFAHHKTRLSKLRRFVRHLGNRMQRQSSRFTRRQHTLYVFSEWIKDASIDQLRKLSMPLKCTDMHYHAKKLSTIFKKLDASNCNTQNKSVKKKSF